MNEKLIFSNDFICITSIDNNVYLKVSKKGLSLITFNTILLAYPQIHIDNFALVKSSIANAVASVQKIGILKDDIQLELMDNNTKAYVTFNISQESLLESTDIITRVDQLLKDNGIVYGVDTSVLLQGKLLPQKRYLVASGAPAIDGENALIKLYIIESTRPNNDGQERKIDFYNLKLINNVAKGEWLGERQEPSLGVDGRTVKGEILKAKPGKTLPLLYDSKSVYEEKKGNVTALYAKISGAVSYIDGKISVANHLELDNVDFNTGNIEFDGCVTIKGTISDGFSVTATRDIEINSNMGVGNIKSITSTHGSIFIKGGIISKGKVEISAAKNLITKYIENAKVTCGENLLIDTYSINSFLSAKQILVTSDKGHIIGGYCKALCKISVPILGCDREKRTIVSVEGFSRSAYENTILSLNSKIEKYKNEKKVVKLALDSLSAINAPSEKQRKDWLALSDRANHLKEAQADCEESRKNLLQCLKVKGDGEISITKTVFPNCQIILAKNIIEITEKSLAITYYYSDEEVKIIT